MPDNYWKLVVALLVQVLVTVPQTDGYASGAPPGACESMIPQHGVDPQSTANPYKVVVNKNTVQGSGIVDITLTSQSGTEAFKGFLIQVREPDGETTVGEFKVDSQTARTVDCFDQERSAATHKSNDDKKSVTVQWVAPEDADGNYQIYYTVVKDGGLFWTRVAAEKGLITVT